MILVGVGHVFDLERPIREIIRSYHPSVIALEIDRGRFNALLHPDGSFSGPYYLRALHAVQKRIASRYNTIPGREMLTAFEGAREIGSSVAFIDMDSRLVMRRLWEALSLKERISLFISIIASLFAGKKEVESELTRFEKSPERFMREIGRRYPGVKRVLIDERDDVMASRIRVLTDRHDSVMAIVGDGHIPGLVRRLRDMEPHVVRLSDLRRGHVIPPQRNTEAPLSGG